MVTQGGMFIADSCTIMHAVRSTYHLFNLYTHTMECSSDIYEYGLEISFHPVLLMQHQMADITHAN